MSRKLDTSYGAGGATAVARSRFDDHLNSCAACQPALCHEAERLWRRVVLTAMKQRSDAEGGIVAAVVNGPVVSGHPGGRS